MAADQQNFQPIMTEKEGGRRREERRDGGIEGRKCFCFPEHKWVFHSDREAVLIASWTSGCDEASRRFSGLNLGLRRTTTALTPMAESACVSRLVRLASGFERSAELSRISKNLTSVS